MQLRTTAIFVCLAVLAGCNRTPLIEAKQDTGPVAVEVAKVTARQIQRVVDSVGTMFPFDEAIISAEIEGPVLEVNADLGDFVKQGQVLVRISEEEQRYLLQQNEAQLRQSLERLGLKSENDRVRDIRETPEVRRAQADLLEAEQRYKRLRSLVDQGIGAPADLDQASARFQSLQAAYDATLYQTRNLMQEVERFKAVVELQRKKLRDTSVRAPFAAHVKERQVTVGQYVRPNAPLFTLVMTDPVRLRLEVPERMAPWIRVGQTADVGVEAFQDRKFTGTVSRISPTVDPTKRTFIVEALIQNPRGELKPGSYARARLATEKIDTVRIVPARAVAYILGSNKVFVISNETVEAREVKLGDRFEKEIEILEGVREGEIVATTQVNRLDTGMKVRVGAGRDPASASNGAVR
jgi:RND family efflux transporter MFP subunit